MYIYKKYITNVSPNKRGFKVLLKDQVLYLGPKSVRGNWILWSSVVSRGPPVASR